MSGVQKDADGQIFYVKQGVAGLAQCLYRRGVTLIAARDSSMSVLVGMVSHVVNRTIGDRQMLTIVMEGGAELTYGMNERVSVQCDYDARIAGWPCDAIPRSVLISARDAGNHGDAVLPEDLYIRVCGSEVYNQPLIDVIKAKNKVSSNAKRLMHARVESVIIAADGNSIAAICLRPTEGERDLMVNVETPPAQGMSVHEVFRR